MRLAIMQPYFFPYIGYFQLMNAVDRFILYDNIQYTKERWINRNRILINGKDAFITLPLKKDSDFLDIRERNLAECWPSERHKILNRVREAYRKAPYFKDAFALFEECVCYPETNLFHFIYNSLVRLKDYLNISTELVVSSNIPIDHHLRAEEKVLALCRSQQASDYFNPIGGIALYTPAHFEERGIRLNFMKSNCCPYQQFDSPFVPALSILDVIMFNASDAVTSFLATQFTLVY